MTASPRRLRRAASIVCYWRDGKLIFENYRTHVLISADPIVVSLLNCFNEWRTAAQALLPLVRVHAFERGFDLATTHAARFPGSGRLGRGACRREVSGIVVAVASGWRTASFLYQGPALRIGPGGVPAGAFRSCAL